MQNKIYKGIKNLYLPLILKNLNGDTKYEKNIADTITKAFLTFKTMLNILNDFQRIKHYLS